MTDFDALEVDQITIHATLGLELADTSISIGATSTTITLGWQSMTLAGEIKAFDLGNAIKFDYQPSFEII